MGVLFRMIPYHAISSQRLVHNFILFPQSTFHSFIHHHSAWTASDLVHYPFRLEKAYRLSRLNNSGRNKNPKFARERRIPNSREQLGRQMFYNFHDDDRHMASEMIRMFHIVSALLRKNVEEYSGGKFGHQNFSISRIFPKMRHILSARPIYLSRKKV